MWGKKISLTEYNRVVSELEEKKQELYRESLYRGALTKGAFFSCEANISTDTLITADSTLLVQLGLPDSPPFSKIIHYISLYIPDSQHQLRFLSAFCNNSLIDSYKDGITDVVVDFLFLLDSDKKDSIDLGNSWVRCCAYLIENPLNEDINVFIYFKNITEIKKQEIDLLEKAEKDALTHLYNKRTVQQLIQETLTLNQATHALLFIDLDNFKKINDLCGHRNGDTVLANFGLLLRSIFRKNDILGRIGGDEFLVCMSNAQTDIVQKRAQEIIDGCHKIYGFLEIDFDVTVSIGIALFPEHGTNLEQLYVHADSALYQSKRNGKNQYSIYDEKRSSFIDVISDDFYMPLNSPIESDQS
jgi:diguanylate cyclase (GGDEF)-like protein